MADLIIFLQQNEGALLKASLSSLKAAREIQDKWKLNGIDAVCLGKGAGRAAEEASAYLGGKVFFSEAPVFDKYLAVPYAQAFLAAMKESGAGVAVAAASSTGKDFFPRVAAALDAGQASDITAVNDDGSFRRPMYAGDAFADVKILSEKKIVTVRASAFPAALKENGGGQTVELKADFQADVEVAGEIVSYELSKGERPELGEAEIVVSGGRALQSGENFEKYIFPLADSLGAAVGASRAAVDAGYVPNDWQVGQTGKIVAPKLYIAVGISGAIQHIAGMKDSKVIVAINKDAEAPIFEIADYGLVGDLYEALPALTEGIKKIRSS